MKYRIFILFNVIVIMSSCEFEKRSTNNKNYLQFVTLGEQALKEHNFESCTKLYESAFSLRQPGYLSLMRGSACAFSTNNKALMNNLLNQTFKVSWGFSKNVYDYLPEFEYLKETEFDSIMNKRFETAIDTSGVNIELVYNLKKIYSKHQLHRQVLNTPSKNEGLSQFQKDSLLTLQQSLDSINIKEVVDIYDNLGIPGKSLVGDAFAATHLIVLRNANITSQEKYLPLIIESADEDELDWTRVSNYIDRLKEKKGEKQIYGSLVKTNERTGLRYFYPIENPEVIDSTRNLVGLEPINSYAQRFGIEWDISKHIENEN